MPCHSPFAGIFIHNDNIEQKNEKSKEDFSVFQEYVKVTEKH